MSGASSLQVNIITLGYILKPDCLSVQDGNPSLLPLSFTFATLASSLFSTKCNLSSAVLHLQLSYCSSCSVKYSLFSVASSNGLLSTWSTIGCIALNKLPSTSGGVSFSSKNLSTLSLVNSFTSSFLSNSMPLVIWLSELSIEFPVCWLSFSPRTQVLAFKKG